MIERKSWDEFRNAKLLWWVNRSLHLFGWSIVVEADESGKVVEVYPAKVDFTGFSEEDEREGFLGLIEYLTVDRRLSEDAATGHGADETGDRNLA